MTKQFIWHNFTVKITKKKIKRTNLRIKPEEPQTIYVSVPCQMSYQTALQIFEQPKILKWIENYQKKMSRNPETRNDWYEEHQSQEPYYRARLQTLLPNMVTKWESRIGVKCNKISIRDTRAQWGSCNVQTGNVSISVWLGAYPEECIEYVVVHELVHLLERGHNEKFYAYLDSYFPTWRECHAKLKNR